MPRSRKHDFHFADHGSITILTPVSRRARNWVEDFVLTNEETQYWGQGIVVEPRSAGPIIDGIFGDGLTVAGV